MDDLMREENPAVLWNRLHQILFDLRWIVLAGQIEAAGDAVNMGIYDDSRSNSKGSSEHDVGSLSRSAGDGKQVFDVTRNLAFEVVFNSLRRANNAPRFVVEEACRTDIISELVLICVSEVGDGRVLLEEAGRDLIDALVGALRGQDRGDKQLPWRVVMQRAGGIGIELVEAFQYSGNALLALGCILRLRDFGRRGGGHSGWMKASS
jgi:hypothetical protein